MDRVNEWVSLTSFLAYFRSSASSSPSRDLSDRIQSCHGSSFSYALLSITSNNFFSLFFFENHSSVKECLYYLLTSTQIHTNLLLLSLSNSRINIDHESSGFGTIYCSIQIILTCIYYTPEGIYLFILFYLFF